jgi:VCBS repeat-containing protein
MLAHTTATFDVRANDVDVDGVVNEAQFAGPQPPFHGNMQWNGDGTFTYTPDGSAPVIAWQYQLKGSFPVTTSNFAIAGVTITPNASVDDTYSTDEDTTLHIDAAAGVLANDEQHTGTVTQATTPAHGTVTLNEDGSFDYTPNANFNGTDSFTYDANGDTGVVTITVDPVDDTPSLFLNTSTRCDPLLICLGSPDNRGNLNEGDNGQLRGSIIDPDQDTGTLAVDWGDGTQESFAYPCGLNDPTQCPFSHAAAIFGGTAGVCGRYMCDEILVFDLHHVYLTDPPDGAAQYDITVSATEFKDPSQTSTATERAVVHDLPPSLTVSPSCSSNCSGSYSVLTQPKAGNVVVGGRVVDPGMDTGRLSISWGDGTSNTLRLACDGTGPCAAAPAQAQQNCTTIPTQACGYFSVSHHYPEGAGDPSSYQVTVLARTNIDPDDLVSPGLTDSETVTALVDHTPPTATPTVSPAPNLAGWNKADVTVTWHWADGADGSGLDSAHCTTSTPSSGEGVQSLSATCNDLVGNVGSASQTVRVDKHVPTAAPTVSAPANTAGWNKTNVTVTWHWTDTGGAGIDAANCTTSSAPSSDGIQTLTATCTDLAGNSGSASYALKIDTAPPVLAPAVAPNPVMLGGSASASANATDTGGSGVSTSSCGAVSTAALGSFSVVCTATDVAGNSASMSPSYVVGVAVTDIVPTPRTKYKAGHAIQIRYVLRGANGQPISATLAGQLSAGCNGKVTMDGLAPVCATYDPRAGVFQANIAMARSWSAGMTIPITVNIVVGSALVGSGSSSIVITK